MRDRVLTQKNYNTQDFRFETIGQVILIALKVAHLYPCFKSYKQSTQMRRNESIGMNIWPIFQIWNSSK